MLFTNFQKFNKHATEMFKVCNKPNSKSNIENFINIFSDPYIISESDSSPLQEHTRTAQTVISNKIY